MYNINPVGIGSLLISSVVSIAAYFGYLGSFIEPYSPFVSIAIALVMTPLIAIITGGRYYLKRSPQNDKLYDSAIPTQVCAVCKEAFESEDMLGCPFHGGSICSLCCTIDNVCSDVCKSLPLIQPLKQF